MKMHHLSLLARANAAFRIKDFEGAVNLYEAALTEAEEPLRSQIKKNHELAMRKLTLTLNKEEWRSKWERGGLGSEDTRKGDSQKSSITATTIDHDNYNDRNQASRELACQLNENGNKNGSKPDDTVLVLNKKLQVALLEGEKQEYEFLKSQAIDWSSYYEDNEHEPTSTDPALDYIRSWLKFKPTISGFFDTDFYLESYPDIKKIGINPLMHFVMHGKSEGRVGVFDASLIAQGGLVFDSMKETIVFVSHESSATGAPLLGLGIADKLSKKYNIVHIVIKKSNIHQAFEGGCDLILHDIQENPYTSIYFFLKNLLRTRNIKSMIINSVVGYQAMHAAFNLNIPLLFLVHEFADYMRPLGTMIDVILHSDYVVTPAEVIQGSMLMELKRFTNQSTKPKNLNIYPQGKLPFIPDTYGENDSIESLCSKLKIKNPDEAKIIVGSGYVQIRKGVDLFIAVARYIKKLYKGPCKFVWVGDGFDPDKDLAFSIYLKREIEFAGLGDDLVFLDHQKNLDTIFSITDVFCLASRMDPFPNVVIDALSHDLHVACFNHGSGSAEFLKKHQANASIVDFVDTYEMASAITQYLGQENKKEGVNLKVLKEHLDFDKYVSYLDELIDESVAFKVRTRRMIDELLESGHFDSEFCGGAGDAEEKCRRYVEYGLKGIHFYNPKIGFSEIDWIAKHSTNNPYVVPLYEALKQGNIETHTVVMLPTHAATQPKLKYAVHLHLYYIDMADYFARYFSNLPEGYDLYITVVETESISPVKNAFKNCGASYIDIVPVENIGRDIGPLIFSLKEKILNNGYDVIGHFHSKKSLDLESGGGDKWLNYLMDILVGDQHNARDVLNIFEQDKKVGLVFPEDRNTTDIGKNREFVAELCNWLELPDIQQTPIFPMGNMFWARAGAIKELFTLDADAVLQPEPLPYDGSHMHALERLTPALAENNGYTFSTLYKEGMAWK